MAVTDVRTNPGRETPGRDRILFEAAALFLANGYAETSMRTIAEAVDIRPASIYHHFPSKDALLEEILAIGMEAVTAAFAAADRSPSADAATRLERHVAAHLNALFTNHAFTAAHVTVFPFVPEAVRTSAIDERDAYEALWTELLAEIAPQLSTDALRLVRLALFGAMNSSVQWFDPAEGSVDELARTIVRTLWDGLGAVA